MLGVTLFSLFNSTKCQKEYFFKLQWQDIWTQLKLCKVRGIPPKPPVWTLRGLPQKYIIDCSNSKHQKITTSILTLSYELQLHLTRGKSLRKYSLKIHYVYLSSEWLYTIPTEGKKQKSTNCRGVFFKLCVSFRKGRVRDARQHELLWHTKMVRVSISMLRLQKTKQLRWRWTAVCLFGRCLSRRPALQTDAKPSLYPHVFPWNFSFLSPICFHRLCACKKCFNIPQQMFLNVLYSF